MKELVKQAVEKIFSLEIKSIRAIFFVGKETDYNLIGTTIRYGHNFSERSWESHPSLFYEFSTNVLKISGNSQNYLTPNFYAEYHQEIIPGVTLKIHSNESNSSQITVLIGPNLYEEINFRLGFEIAFKVSDT